jgi:hypothetical protein
MSNAPEWVDPEGDESSEVRRPPDERVVVTNTVRAAIDTMTAATAIINNGLLRLDEMGEPVKRSRVRANKLPDVVAELSAVFDYDVVRGNGARTTDQKIRAERHELS